MLLTENLLVLSLPSVAGVVVIKFQQYEMSQSLISAISSAYMIRWFFA